MPVTPRGRDNQSDSSDFVDLCGWPAPAPVPAVSPHRIMTFRLPGPALRAANDHRTRNEHRLAPCTPASPRILLVSTLGVSAAGTSADSRILNCHRTLLAENLAASSLLESSPLTAIPDMVGHLRTCSDRIKTYAPDCPPTRLAMLGPCRPSRAGSVLQRRINAPGLSGSELTASRSAPVGPHGGTGPTCTFAHQRQSLA